MHRLFSHQHKAHRPTVSTSKRYGSKNNREANTKPGIPLFLQKSSSSTASKDHSADMSYPYSNIISNVTGSTIPGRAVHAPWLEREYGVPAFTDGLNSYFAVRSPAIDVAGHEAAHQLQNSGKTNSMGLHPEIQADAVGRASVHNTSALSVIGKSGAPTRNTVRLYTPFTTTDQTDTGDWQLGQNARVSRDGNLLTPAKRSHIAYAKKEIIESANRILEARQSGVRLWPLDETISGMAPDSSGRKKLNRVGYQILTSDTWPNPTLYDDCGRSSHEVAGPSGTDSNSRAVYIDNAGNEQETSPSWGTDAMRGEILMNLGLGSTPAEAWTAYQSLPDRDDFDRRHGLNVYAQPGVGEGYAADRAGSYNYHFGTVVLVSGGDRITFENYTRDSSGNFSIQTDRWFFAMYGPSSEPAQTFHGVWGDADTTTMVHRTSPDPSAHTENTADLSTPELIRRQESTTDKPEKMAINAELRNRSIRVYVKVHSTEDTFGEDEVYVRIYNRKLSFLDEESGVVGLNDGSDHTFILSIDDLVSEFASLANGISVQVYDEDSPDSDDLIVWVAFQPPFSTTSNQRSYDGATYEVHINFPR